MMTVPNEQESSMLSGSKRKTEEDSSNDDHLRNTTMNDNDLSNPEHDVALTSKDADQIASNNFSPSRTVWTDFSPEDQDLSVADASATNNSLLYPEWDDNDNDNEDDYDDIDNSDPYSSLLQESKENDSIEHRQYYRQAMEEQQRLQIDSNIAESSIIFNETTLPYKGLTGRMPMQMYLTCNEFYFTLYQCLIRKQIEYFEVTSQDLNTIIPGRNRNVLLGQVGVRCKSCTSMLNHTLDNSNGSQHTIGSVYFPSKLLGIYQACQNMATSHFLGTCPTISSQICEELSALHNNIDYINSSSSKLIKKSSGKAGWAYGATVIGIYEDNEDNILRFDPAWTTKVLSKAEPAYSTCSPAAK